MVKLFSRRRVKSSSPTLANAQAAQTWHGAAERHVLENADELGRSGHLRRPASPPLRRSLSVNDAVGELQLRYGHWVVGADVELDVDACEEIVRVCSEQIKARGLDFPLLFSSQALDLNSDNVAALIGSYLSNRRTWPGEVLFANPHDLGAVIKWALGRLVNPQGGHGFLLWDMYERWRLGETEKGYPARYISTHFLHHLPVLTSRLLATLLSLMSSATAYTIKNGTTPRRLAAIFSSYIFGLPTDQSFEATYSTFRRFSHATEHLLLAFIRDQNEVGHHTPTKLLPFIAKYPPHVDLNSPTPAAQLQRTTRITRFVRFQSQDLIATAGSWQVPGSPAWDSISTSRTLSALEGTPSYSFTSVYRQMLNLHKLSGSIDDAEAMMRYRNPAEMEWHAFQYDGFTKTDQDWLKFDLRASERSNRRERLGTLEWTSFEHSGFRGRESFVDTDLKFDARLSDEITAWPQERRSIEAKLRKVEKELPPFPYDTTPYEIKSVLIDEVFFEAWCDVLVSSGWLNANLKESNWVLVQFRCRPMPRPTKTDVSEGQEQTVDRWFLIEENTPLAYLRSLQQAQNKATKHNKSFMRTVRRKPAKSAPSPKYLPVKPSSPLASSLAQPVRSGLDNSVFEAGPGETKRVKASNMTIGLSPAVSRSGSMKTWEGSSEGAPSLRVGISGDRSIPPTSDLLPKRVPQEARQSLGVGNFVGIGGTLSSQPSGFRSAPRSAPSSPHIPPSPTLPSKGKRRSMENFVKSLRRRSDQGSKEPPSGAAGIMFETYTVSPKTDETVKGPKSRINHVTWTEMRPGQDEHDPVGATDEPAGPIPPPKDLPSVIVEAPTITPPASSDPQEDDEPYGGIDNGSQDTHESATFVPARASLEDQEDTQTTPTLSSVKPLPAPIEDAPTSSPKVPVQPEPAKPETPLERATRLRLRYGGGVSAAQRNQNVTRLISLYARRDDDSEPIPKTA